MPEKHNYCRLSGKKHFFDWPAVAIKPIWTGYEDVFGCGLVLSPDDKLAIFFTTNGIQMGQLSTYCIRGIAKNKWGNLLSFYIKYKHLGTGLLLGHLGTELWDETY
jgi:hypothetical protein